MVKDTTPRISVNKLAEYIVSKGGRQRQILRDQKFPTEYKGPYYKEAAEPIAAVLADNLEDLTPITKAINVLNQMQPEKIGTQRRINSNIDALESFEAMLDEIDFQGATPSLGAHTSGKLKIQNVEISVRPEIILRGKGGKSGKKLVGGAKLHFPRTFRLTEDAAGYVSAIVQEFLKAYYSADGEPHGPYCPVLDIGSQTFFAGVKSTAARMKDVAAECRNIAGLWPTIQADE
jgi:hypothetical protein